MNRERLLELRNELKAHDRQGFKLNVKTVNALAAIIEALIPPETVEECEREIGDNIYASEESGYYLVDSNEFHWCIGIPRTQLEVAQLATIVKRITALMEEK